MLRFTPIRTFSRRTFHVVQEVIEERHSGGYHEWGYQVFVEEHHGGGGMQDLSGAHELKTVTSKTSQVLKVGAGNS